MKILKIILLNQLVGIIINLIIFIGIILLLINRFGISYLPIQHKFFPCKKEYMYAPPLIPSSYRPNQTFKVDDVDVIGYSGSYIKVPNTSKAKMIISTCRSQMFNVIGTDCSTEKYDIRGCLVLKLTPSGSGELIDNNCSIVDKSSREWDVLYYAIKY